MAGRPRTISEERIMVALATAVGRVGPGRLTLADVAREAGVSTGVLVGRYGSKRDLLLGFVRWGLAETGYSDPAAKRNPRWIRAIYNAMRARGGIAFTYFNTNLNSVANWKLSLATKQNAFTRPDLAGSTNRLSSRFALGQIWVVHGGLGLEALLHVLMGPVSCAQPVAKPLVAEPTHALISLSRTARSVVDDLTR